MTAQFKPKRHSDLTTVVEFDGVLKGLVATVRYFSPDHNREVLEAATRHGKVNWERYHRGRCDAIVEKLEGLTEAIFDALVELEPDSARPPVGVDQLIDATPDVIFLLWQHAQPDDFQGPCTRAAEELLKLVAAEKKRRSNPSGA